MIASAGKVASHQAVAIYVRASLIITPHSGVGGWAPKPMNERPATEVIAAPMSKLACTSSGASVLGSRCRRTIRHSGTPTVRAARMNSRSLSASTCPRIRRAYTGHVTALIAISAFCRLGPSAPAIAIARISAGKAKKMSVMRISASSAQPPR